MGSVTANETSASRERTAASIGPCSDSRGHPQIGWICAPSLFAAPGADDSNDIIGEKGRRKPMRLCARSRHAKRAIFERGTKRGLKALKTLGGAGKMAATPRSVLADHECANGPTGSEIRKLLEPRQREQRLKVRRQSDSSDGPRRAPAQPNLVARKETAQNDEHFHCREGGADADARADAVRHPRRRCREPPVLQEASGVKSIGLAPMRRVSVDDPRRYDNSCATRYSEAPDLIVDLRFAHNDISGRKKPQALIEKGRGGLAGTQRRPFGRRRLLTPA